MRLASEDTVKTIRYYAGGTQLNDLVADPSADIGAVVREVERLCDREAHASAYYREHPELLYPSHPWSKFVDSGSAAHLGWHADGTQGSAWSS